MAYLGDIGEAFAVSNQTFCRSPFTVSKQPVWVDIDLDGSTPVNRVQLFKSAGTFVDRANVDATGHTHFYDVEDGGYNAYEVSTGNAWSITVVGAVVTIVRISSTGTPISVYAA